MNHEVVLTRNAQKHMRALPHTIRTRIRSRLRSLGDDPYRGAVKLKVAPGYRLRVGEYRILYEVDDKRAVVTVKGIRHRREAYK